MNAGALASLANLRKSHTPTTRARAPTTYDRQRRQNNRARESGAAAPPARRLHCRQAPGHEDPSVPASPPASGCAGRRPAPFRPALPTRTAVRPTSTGSPASSCAHRGRHGHAGAATAATLPCGAHEATSYFLAGRRRGALYCNRSRSGPRSVTRNTPPAVAGPAAATSLAALSQLSGAWCQWLLHRVRCADIFLV